MSKPLNVKSWAVDTAIRAVKTGAQTAVAALGVNATGLLHVDWAAVGSLAGLAAATCVLQNLATLNVGPAPVEAPAILGKALVDAPADPAPAVEPAPEAPAPSADAAPVA